jgi:uncharacterized protein YoxC
MSSKSGELKIFDNKQLIHIASEVVVLIGLTFYFSSKNKKLLGHVEELAQRLEEQEDRIQKLEVSIQQISQKMDSLVQQMNNGFMQIGQSLQQTNANVSELISREDEEIKKPVKTKKHTKPVTQPIYIHSKPILSESKEQSRQPPKVQFTDPPRVSKHISKNEKPEPEEEPEEELEEPEEELEEEELEDSDLDSEIRTELNELKEEHDSGLKKET